jgi:hypothetical protein
MVYVFPLPIYDIIRDYVIDYTDDIFQAKTSLTKQLKSWINFLRTCKAFTVIGNHYRIRHYSSEMVKSSFLKSFEINTFMMCTGERCLYLKDKIYFKDGLRKKTK